MTANGLALTAVGLLVVAAAVLAAAETALTRLSKAQAVALAEEGRRGAAALQRLLDDPARHLGPVLLVLLVCHLSAATIVGVLAGREWGAVGVAAALAAEVAVIFVVSEAAPKTLAIQHPERIGLLVAPLVTFMVSLWPLRMVTTGLIRTAGLLLPGRGRVPLPGMSEQELLAMADVAAAQDVIESEERALIHSIIGFGDTVARHVMVPRTDMVAVDAEAPATEAMEVVLARGFSRIPVVGENPDDIVGVVFAKDLMRAQRDGHRETPVSELARPAVFVPETKPVAELMHDMQNSTHHMAIVIDEHGGTAGLVTLEDLIEELVGEIVDEYDVEEPAVEPVPEGGIRVSARMTVSEVNELLDDSLPEGDWDTVGGLVYDLLGHVPAEGETVDCNGHRLRAEKVQGRRIGRVRITHRRA